MSWSPREQTVVAGTNLHNGSKVGGLDFGLGTNYRSGYMTVCQNRQLASLANEQMKPLRTLLYLQTWGFHIRITRNAEALWLLKKTCLLPFTFHRYSHCSLLIVLRTILIHISLLLYLIDTMNILRLLSILAVVATAYADCPGGNGCHYCPHGQFAVGVE